MDTVKLSAKLRDDFGRKTNKSRKTGLIPAVIYGHGLKNQSLWINNLDFSRLLKKSGQSSIIELSIDGKGKHNVIVYEIQRDPVTDHFRHIDFFQVRMDEEIEKEVELVFVGESPAVKEASGVLVKNISDIKVKCLPADLPKEIEVDISKLKTFDDRIVVKDLKISPKVKFEIDPETVVAMVEPPRSDEELSKLEEKVEADVTKVEGVVKEASPEEITKEENAEDKKE